ncbi:unnamed protein product, partial [Amoebophrya sp. A25]
IRSVNIGKAPKKLKTGVTAVSVDPLLREGVVISPPSGGEGPPAPSELAIFFGPLTQYDYDAAKATLGSFSDTGEEFTVSMEEHGIDKCRYGTGDHGREHLPYAVWDTRAD